jgi:hypothetical protein
MDDSSDRFECALEVGLRRGTRSRPSQADLLGRSTAAENSSLWFGEAGEDALDLIIRLRATNELSGDAALGSLQRKLEERLSAFDELRGLWEKAGFPKRPKP